jgi:hypothetical protein
LVTTYIFQTNLLQTNLLPCWLSICTEPVFDTHYR